MSDQLWAWATYDRMVVSLETVDKFREFFLFVSRVTEADAESVWPLSDTPDWDYDRNRPYPYHLLHHKFRLWQKGERPFSASCKHDIMSFLMHADDGHKDRFYSWMMNAFQKTTHASSLIAWESYRPSEGTDLFRVHSLLHHITCMCTVNQERRHAIFESAIGQLTTATASTASATATSTAETSAGKRAEDSLDRVMQAVLDYDSPSSISFLFESGSPEERKALVDEYALSLHPKESDRSLSTRPPLSTTLKRDLARQKARYRALESLFYNDNDNDDE